MAEAGTGVERHEEPTPVLKSERAQQYNDLFNLARMVSGTAMIPKPLQGRPEEAFAVMVYGAEIGIEPMAALRSIHIIEGTPTASATLMRALIQRAGHWLSWREVSTERVVLYGRHRNGGEATVTWTLADARRAELAGKVNWKRYPRSMLAARVTSELARLLFADCLFGLQYTPEEMGAAAPYDVIDVDAEDIPLTEEDTVDEDKAVHAQAADILDAEEEQDRLWLAAAAGEEEGEPS
jgi:hypothetical protein